MALAALVLIKAGSEEQQLLLLRGPCVHSQHPGRAARVAQQVGLQLASLRSAHRASGAKGKFVPPAGYGPKMKAAVKRAYLRVLLALPEVVVDVWDVEMEEAAQEAAPVGGGRRKRASGGGNGSHGDTQMGGNA